MKKEISYLEILLVNVPSTLQEYPSEVRIPPSGIYLNGEIRPNLYSDGNYKSPVFST